MRDINKQMILVNCLKDYPNEIGGRKLVSIKEVFKGQMAGEYDLPLILPIGTDENDCVICLDLENSGNIFICGATGVGKSVLINNIIASLVIKNTADSLELILVDPKMVEFTQWNNLSHLKNRKIIYEANDVNVAIDNLLYEVENRINAFKSEGVYTMKDYNEKVRLNNKAQFKSIVFIIDEIADLLLYSNSKQTVNKLSMLLQKCRSAGIYVIASSQCTQSYIFNAFGCNFSTKIALKIVTHDEAISFIGNEIPTKLLNGQFELLKANGQISLGMAAYIDVKEIERLTNLLFELNC